jgi:hypothetical protein
LVITSLQKRLLSSIEAFACTLRVHRKAIENLDRAAASSNDLNPETLPLLAQAPGADDDRAELDEEEVRAEEEAQMAATTSATSQGGMERELALIRQMESIAEQARYQVDSRLAELIKWVRDNLCPDLGEPGAAWLDRRVLIFTEYTDTKRYLQQQLELAIDGSDQAAERIGTYHGGIGEAKRELIKTAFNSDPATHPLRILIATDAAREGINLQNHCADLFHFDIPWNPGRMEQRNGRIDRKLQRAPLVRCSYFVLPQRAEDRVLEVLVRKTQTIQDELGSLTPVIDRRLTDLVADGISHDQVETLAQSIEEVERTEARSSCLVVEEELEQVRQRRDDLLAQLQELSRMLKVSKDWIGLEPAHFRDALSASLELMGAQGLRQIGADLWEIPALDQRLGADPAWAAMLDTLRLPKKKGMKPWEWRRECPPRPVVFKDPGTLDAKVVHLHLEHRLVQRLLERFRSQGFLHHELTRACVVPCDDPIPYVVALGRLTLLGRSAVRLHDEIVAIAAEWTDPSTRGRSRLKPMSEGDKRGVLQLLERSLADPRPKVLDQTLSRRLAGSALQDVAELIPRLEKRAEELAESAARRLDKRGDREAQQMREILESQQDRISRRIDQDMKDQKKQKEQRQQAFEFDERERRQLEADRRHWRDRLFRLEAELITEPERVRRTYEVATRRVVPAGLVYLWPVSR